MKSEMLNFSFHTSTGVINVAGVIRNTLTSGLPERCCRAIRLLGVLGRREYVITFSCSLLYMLTIR